MLWGALASSAFVSFCPYNSHRSGCSISSGDGSSTSSRSARFVLHETRGQRRASYTSRWIYPTLRSDAIDGSSTALQSNSSRRGCSRVAKGRKRQLGQAVSGWQDGLCQVSEPEVGWGKQPGGRFTGDVVLDDRFEELEDRVTPYPCVLHNALGAPTPYSEGWAWQKQAVEQRTRNAPDLSEPDVVLMTQHNPVFTLGTGSTRDNLKFSPEDAPFEVVRTERGGEVTYHGPGQIVLYPIMNLRRYRQDIHWYLRALEETVIRALSKLGLCGERIEGLTGVWVKGHKVAAVGVRVKRWITMHGLSLNVRPDLTHFQHIVPCGIEDRPVGSVEQLCRGDEDTSLERVGALLIESFEEVFGVDTMPMDDFP
ncbi:unnamed protein product [Sphacelaria rigidula]